MPNRLATPGGAGALQALRTCPVCRLTSHYIVPSLTWPTSAEEKEAVVAGGRPALAASGSAGRGPLATCHARPTLLPSVLSRQPLNVNCQLPPPFPRVRRRLQGQAVDRGLPLLQLWRRLLPLWVRVCPARSAAQAGHWPVLRVVTSPRFSASQDSFLFLPLFLPLPLSPLQHFLLLPSRLLRRHPGGPHLAAQGGGRGGQCARDAAGAPVGLHRRQLGWQAAGQASLTGGRGGQPCTFLQAEHVC